MSAEWTDHRDGSYSFTSGPLGWRRARFGLRVDGVDLLSTRDYRLRSGCMESGKTRETVRLCERGDNWVAIRRDVTNVSPRSIAVCEIRDFVSPEPPALGGAPEEMAVYHAEAVFEWGRYKVPFAEMARRPAKTLLGDPLSPHFGATGWSPYTGIIFCCDRTGAGLIEGVLSQDRFYRYWTPQTDGRVDAVMGMHGLDAKRIDPGETLEGEIIYLEIAPKLDWHDPFGSYNRALRRHITPHAELSRHGKDFVWGSWNDGPYNMVHDFVVRENADFVKAHFPSVNWVQIDEGYQVFTDRELAKDPTNPDTGFGRPRIAHYHYAERENEGICARKFPDGMKAVADYIRRKGLRPAVWTGLTTTLPARIAREHPGWFQDPIHIWGDLSPLVPDVSVPECMEFIKEGFRRLVRDWGYEGIKLDFWTHSFIANQRPYARPFRFSQGNKTGLEYMHELLGFVRELLGDGYLETGCDISCGNPFIGRYADNFRYGMDIGDGDWRWVVLDARWMAFHALAAHRFGYLANSDSIGVMRKLTPAARRAWMNFCFISGTMLEIGGDFAAAMEKVDKEYLRQGNSSLAGATFGCPPGALADLQRISARIENGARVFFPDTSYLDGATPPALWIKCDAEEKPAYAGIFNWSTEAAEVALPMEYIRRLGALSDFWLERPWQPPDAPAIRLGGCESLLLRVERSGKIG